MAISNLSTDNFWGNSLLFDEGDNAVFHLELKHTALYSDYASKDMTSTEDETPRSLRYTEGTAGFDLHPSSDSNELCERSPKSEPKFEIEESELNLVLENTPSNPSSSSSAAAEEEEPSAHFGHLDISNGTFVFSEIQESQLHLFLDIHEQSMEPDAKMQTTVCVL